MRQHPPMHPAAQGEVHALSLSWAPGCIMGTGTTCHEQCTGPEIAPPSTSCPAMVPGWTNPASLQGGAKLAETGFSHPRLFPGQAEINTPEGDYIKQKQVTFSCLLIVHTVSINHLHSSPTSKAAKYHLGSQVIAPSPCMNNICHPPLTSRQCYPVFRGSIVPGDTTKLLQMGAHYHGG